MVDSDSIEQIPENIKNFYNDISRSMLRQIRNRGIRKYSGTHIDRWLRLSFPINEDKMVLKKHKMVGTQVSKYLLRQTNDYKIPLKDIRDIIDLESKLQHKEDQEKLRFEKLKMEVEEIRNQRRKERGPRTKITRTLKTPKIKNILKSKTSKASLGINYDKIYKPWMEHVATKSTSKSYWYIHEYIARYILNFAIERKAESLNKVVVQEFLEEYGQGKAAKTMNHYTRVANYFLEFSQSLN
ncbi:MAG: hypothetical protein GPJ54_07565 [Candidatus Heimdallarchaeota archaeon]|nr:hypothetical protein [Candidatus Heimdallarchaeota archaeon]